jgi:UDP-glucose:(heptosyl)LPS alpha-1,3-glucosyltransferase
VIPNGVDSQQFRPDAIARRTVRIDRGAGSDDVIALFVGGRWTQKGLELAIRGMGLARQAGADSLSLWVAGAGDPGRYLDIASRLHVREHVHFFGYVTDTERLYQAADMFVLPSAYETFCMVAYEAASTGLPVVATAVNGVSELIQDNKGGFVVDPSAQSVGDAMFALTRDTALRRRMGETARLRAAASTWPKAVGATVQLYEDLMNEQAVSGGGGRR